MSEEKAFAGRDRHSKQWVSVPEKDHLIGEVYDKVIGPFPHWNQSRQVTDYVAGLNRGTIPTPGEEITR